MAYTDKNLFMAEFSPIHVLDVEKFVIDLKDCLARHGASVAKWDFRPSDEVLTVHFPIDHRPIVKSVLKFRFMMRDFKLCVLPEMTMRDTDDGGRDAYERCLYIETRDFNPGIARRNVWDGSVQHISWEEDNQTRTA
jgi:hypothetical protein